MKATLGIPTYLRGMVLIETIESVLATCPADVPVIVVDQTPQHDPDLLEGIARVCKDSRVKWVKQAPANLPAARNVILREADTEVVIFVDDDVLISPGFVEKHLEAHAEGVGAVAGNAYQTMKAKDAHDATLRRWTLLADETYVTSVIGCNFSTRRASAIAIGGFDESFEGSAFGEEEDFCLRLKKAGFTIAAAPGAKLVHLRSPSGGCRVGASPMEEWKKSVGWLILLFRYKHSRQRWIHLWKYAMLCGPFRRENWGNPFAIARCIPPFFVSMRKARSAKAPQVPLSGCKPAREDEAMASAG